MPGKLDPLALAQQTEDDDRPGVQPVHQEMIYRHVWADGNGELPLRPSAEAFAVYAQRMWFDAATDSDGTITNGEVINRLLADWRGNG